MESIQDRSSSSAKDGVTMIELKDVTKTYERGSSQVHALNNLNLRIEDAEFLAVMGPSGSGKSTLLYTLGGLLTPSQGEVIVNEQSIYTLSSRHRASFRRNHVGFIFQTFELLPYLTALENVMLPLYLRGASSTQQTTKAEAALKEVGLAQRAFHKPTELSGGEQQRVAIARGIVNNPDILLADEPTGNLDQKTGEEIMQILHDLYETIRMTVIIVTHDPTIAQHANRVIKMIDGKIVPDVVRQGE